MKEIKNNDHCGKIAFMKFIFAVIILIYHTNSRFQNNDILLFNGGSIAVEFFFIVSGFLFCKKYIRHKSNKRIGQTMMEFIISKTKKFLPYVIILLIVSIPFQIYLFNYSNEKFVYIIYTLLYLPVNAAHQDLIFQIFWYISAMIIAETLILPFLLKYKENYAEIASPIIFFITFNYILIKFKTFGNPWEPSIFFFYGVIRAISLLNLGIFLFTISDKLKNVQYTKFGIAVLTIIENLGYLSLFYIMNTERAHQRFDVLMILIMAICVTISFSNKISFNKFFNNKTIYKLEQLSITIYTNQFLVLNCLDKYKSIYAFKINYFGFILIELLILIIFGLVEQKLIDVYNKKSNIIKSWVIKESK